MTDQTTVSVSDGLISLPAIIELADTYKLSAKAFAFTFRQIAMPQPHTEAEFVSCCLVAKEHQLNPLTKEIYFMRDKHGRIQAIVGVDGWIKKCNEHPSFDGLEFSDSRDDKGRIVSMTCSIYRKDRSRPTTITEYFSECVQVRDKTGPWQTHPSRQMRTRTLCQCARIAFGFAGIMERDEFDQWQARLDVTPSKPELSGGSGLLEIPDIPEAEQDTQGVISGGQSQDKTPDTSPNEADTDADITDVDGFLAKLADDIHYCESADELAEIAESNADLIARLPATGKARAVRMLQNAAE